MRAIVMALAALLTGWTAASAQDASASPDASADAMNSVAPVSSYPLGRADLVASGLMGALRLNRIKEDLCERYGCLVVVNESRAYKVMEMRVEMAGRGGTKRWGPNQLDRRLPAMQATLRVKVPDLAPCDLPVRFLLRETKGRAEVTLDGTVRLCAEPDRHTLMRIRVVKPTVEVVE